LEKPRVRVQTIVAIEEILIGMRLQSVMYSLTLNQSLMNRALLKKTKKMAFIPPIPRFMTAAGFEI
jgi:hypothetical protein